MKGFGKPDEMEKYVNLKAVRWAWLYSAVFLLIWIGYDWILLNSFNSTAFILLMSQLIIFWTLQIFLKWKLGKNEK
jgi:hypothetical protein